MPRNYLYRNQGDGTFCDVSRETGVDKAQRAYSMTSVAADFSNSAWNDICVASDSTPQPLLPQPKEWNLSASVFISLQQSLSTSSLTSIDDAKGRIPEISGHCSCINLLLLFLQQLRPAPHLRNGFLPGKRKFTALKTATRPHAFGSVSAACFLVTSTSGQRT